MIGAVTGIGPSQDSPDFTPAMRQAATLLDLSTVLADAGYDAEHNHRLCRDELGIERSIIALNRRNTGRRWPKTPYRRTLRQHFPCLLYHQRWHIESGFSQHKRRLGSALTTCGHQAQRRELILRVLTHNLMILKSEPRRFQQSKRLTLPDSARAPRIRWKSGAGSMMPQQRVAGRMPRTG
jgi:transposase